MTNFKISTIIITKDEEKMIEGCLKTLNWVDEVIVVDTGNADTTNKIAKKYGAKIVKYQGPFSYAKWRNKGLREANGEWVLYIDADERATSQLKEEISKRIDYERFVAYAIPRKNFIFGKEFKHCGQWPDYQKRLFKKSEFETWKGDLHESAYYNGEMGYLTSPMIHIKHETLSEMVEKTNDWSEVEARLMFEAHHPKMNIRRFLSAALREFFKRMIFQTAFLDGGEGIIYAMYQVFSRFVSYAKLWEMQITKK